MPRLPFGQADPAVRADALKRHALTRRMERREKWLERAGVTPALLKEAVETLQAGMRATKLVPAVVDRKGNVISERVEVPDHAVRVKAAADIADFVRLVSGLTAEKPDTKPASVETTIIVGKAEWLQKLSPAETIDAEPVTAIDAETR